MRQARAVTALTRPETEIAPLKAAIDMMHDGGTPTAPAEPRGMAVDESLTPAGPGLALFSRTNAMCWAAAEGNVDALRRLREHGADVNAADYDKR